MATPSYRLWLLGLTLVLPLATAQADGYFRAETGAGIQSGTWPARGAWSGTVQPYGAGGYGYGYGYGYGSGGRPGYGYGGYGRPPPYHGYGWPQYGTPGDRHHHGNDRDSRNYLGDPSRRDDHRRDRHRDSRFDSRREEPYYGAPSGRLRERRSTLGEPGR